jgi:hypothetical protein
VESVDVGVGVDLGKPVGTIVTGGKSVVVAVANGQRVVEGAIWLNKRVGVWTTCVLV